ncbi:hypothetical protein D8Y22_15795 [Salinadaptatus halalkaliphilus]|uniref:Antitoxin n=1 Tax=Salinadaptatus halalkaliphilus TaxID=2419781 RepID=A0A4S3TIR5_9EURY|nr:antitoxin VapB family protein [Salinadaptatus halalkaliphilus]THE63929.1 hypothetical protein D8Y22_15795 [Salinadaptatus halalkaliphilus]
MGRNTSAFDADTYRRLLQTKRDDESTSDVIDRLLARHESNPLRELIGLVDGDELETVRNRSTAFRADVDDSYGLL